MASIDDFKSNLRGGGARANQYRVIMSTPGAIQTGLDATRTQYMVKATSLPGQTIPEVTVNFRGRQLFLAGDRTFETWTTTVINDTDFMVRNAMERWMNAINDLEENTGLTNVSDYTAQLVVQQLDRDDRILKSYTLRNCWPTIIAPIELSYDTVSDIESFDVTWRYTSFSASSV
tara:strand:- start:936 stop:1460 length:525 start_codon:yes stop_codon:yes gene_type:complete